MSRIESQAHTWLATHMCTHAHACVHTPLWTPCEVSSSGALWFSDPWYHAEQIFLFALMSPWHGVYLDGQLVFGILIDVQCGEKEKPEESWRKWASEASVGPPRHEERGHLEGGGRSKVNLVTSRLTPFNLKRNIIHMGYEIYWT